MVNTTHGHPNGTDVIADRIMERVGVLSPSQQKYIMGLIELLCERQAQWTPNPGETSSQYGICDYCGTPHDQWRPSGLCVSCHGV